MVGGFLASSIVISSTAICPAPLSPGCGLLRGKAESCPELRASSQCQGRWAGALPSWAVLLLTVSVLSHVNLLNQTVGEPGPSGCPIGMLRHTPLLLFCKTQVNSLGAHIPQMTVSSVFLTCSVRKLPLPLDSALLPVRPGLSIA